ncbi:MAG: hypothetical protein RLZZ144_640 [Pseudomonadota bacterium]
MLYTIIGHDTPNSLENRLTIRPAHVARLQALQADGRLVLAGPFPAVDSNEPGAAGFTGSLIVAEFPSLNEAQNWADAEPYLSAGVYESVEVRPFKKTFPS